MRRANVVDYKLLEMQGKAIDQVIEEIDYVLAIVYEQQEEIEYLQACVEELERLAFEIES